MSFIREIEQRQAELAGLRAILQRMPDDPLAKPLMASRVRSLQAELDQLEETPPAKPEAELLFAGKPVLGSAGIDAKFAARVLDSFQDMVSNHHAASRHGAVGSRGPRASEGESRLFLSALPRGSFGLLLTQPQVEDFVTAAQVMQAMEQITALVEASASGDAAFSETVGNFHPRVLAPLEKFLSALETQEASVKLRTGTRQVALKPEQLQAAHARVAAASPEEERVTLRGVCRGVLLESWRFDFVSEGAAPITGALSDAVSEDQAKAILALVDQPGEADFKVTRIRTRSGLGRPAYELLSLKA